MKWTKDKIMARLQEQYNEALKYFPEDRIVGIFLQGSQNYGLATDESDIDSKLIVLPTFEDICFARKPVSTTHICENDEHIDFKDIRLMFQTFRKQNLNFIEILFTEYRIINPIYEHLWMIIDEEREAIARYNVVKCLLTMSGIASEKYHAMEHHYPSSMHMIEKFGYDPKQLHHLLRIEEFLNRYVAGEPFADCLVSKIPEYLVSVKQGRYSLPEARLIGVRVYETIREAVTFEKVHGKEECNPEVDELLDFVQKEIMKEAIRRELEVADND